MSISEIFNSIYPVSEMAISRIESFLSLRKVRKGEAVIRQGEKTGIILFIVKGIFRIVLNCDGKERILAFGMAGDPFTSVSSLRCDEPSFYSFEAVTDAEIFTIPINNFKQLVDSNEEISRWFIALLLEQLHAFERRGALFSGCNAAKKYEAFVFNRPEIMRHVPAKYIAQYLDIAPETLSRIQSAYFKSKRTSLSSGSTQ